MAKSDRNGKRTRRSVRARTPKLGYYFIVTDTAATEENYLYGLRDALPMSVRDRIVIKVSTSHTEDLVKVCREQASLHPQYAEPWIVFDRDQVHGFDQMIKSANHEGIHTGWSNPCIEVWFEAYFRQPQVYADSVACCRGFSDIFKRKTGQSYKKSDKAIYSVLNQYGDEDAAIKIAETRLRQCERERIVKPSKMDSCTTLNRLVSEIKTKAADEVKLNSE